MSSAIYTPNPSFHLAWMDQWPLKQHFTDQCVIRYSGRLWVCDALSYPARFLVRCSPLQIADDAFFFVCFCRVSINPECITAFNELRLGRGKTKYIIFKIADNRQEIVVDEVSKEDDYDVFRTKLEEATDSKGNPTPRYAVYDVHFELEGGEGKRFVSPCRV